MRKINKIKAPKTISESVYAFLKKAIIEGDLKPSQRIQEKEIAQLFNVSTTPAREAFQRLSAEKYLTINARKEVSVVSISQEEIREMFEVVRVLDAFATKKAINNLSEKDIEDLKKMTNDLMNLSQEDKIGRYVKQNLKIHFFIWKRSGNKFLFNSLVELGEKFTFYSNQLFAIIDNPSFLKRSCKEHLEIIDALEKKDSERVEKLLLVHWGGEGFLKNTQPKISD